MASWKVEVVFDTKMYEATVDDQMKLTFTKTEAPVSLEELQRLSLAISQVVYFLRNNSGTRFEVTEQP